MGVRYLYHSGGAAKGRAAGRLSQIDFRWNY